MFSTLLALCCVAVASARHTFIVGGSEAQVGAWKYQLSLRNKGSHTCGASLISSTWALCAAHCAYTYASAYTVVAGMHDQARNQGDPEEYKVSNIYKHPNYIPSGGYPNDIALFKLSSTVDLSNNYVELATMAPDDGFTYAGSECYISGWGLTRDGGNIASKLQQADIDVITNADCRDYWGSTVNDRHVCIFDKDSRRVSACSGDSGGPLSCRRNGKMYVVGIASWVAGGCNPAYPGAYTRVSEFRYWIKNIAGV